MFVLPLTNAYIVQVHYTPKLPQLSVTNMRLPPGPTEIARSMPPGISKVVLTLAYRLLLNHRAALLQKMADKNARKAQAQYTMDHDKDVQFEPRFAAGDNVSLERLTVMVSAADQMGYKRYSKIPPCRTVPHQVLRFGPEFKKIDQHGIWNIASINGLSRVAKKERPKMEITSDLGTKTDTNNAIRT